jgi:hypothetical protein
MATQRATAAGLPVSRSQTSPADRIAGLFRGSDAGHEREESNQVRVYVGETTGMGFGNLTGGCTPPVLFSLLDNGGLKTLNSCEVMMILTAAARGLTMLKATSTTEEESLRPLARRQ